MIRAVLSQRHGPKQILHPIAYLTRKFTPAKRYLSKYKIFDKELLAIQTAFESGDTTWKGPSSGPSVYRSQEPGVTV